MATFTDIISHGFVNHESTAASLKRKWVKIRTGIRKTVDTTVSIRGFLTLGFIDIF